MTPQPTGIEAAVCADITARQQTGIAKYGTTVADNPGDTHYWLRHFYEELLDAAVYARRIIEGLTLPLGEELRHIEARRAEILEMMKKPLPTTQTTSNTDLP